MCCSLRADALCHAQIGEDTSRRASVDAVRRRAFQSVPECSSRGSPRGHRTRPHGGTYSSGCSTCSRSLPAPTDAYCVRLNRTQLQHSYRLELPARHRAQAGWMCTPTTTARRCQSRGRGRPRHGRRLPQRPRALAPWPPAGRTWLESTPRSRGTPPTLRSNLDVNRVAHGRVTSTYAARAWLSSAASCSVCHEMRARVSSHASGTAA